MIDELLAKTEFYLTLPEELPAGIAESFALVLARTQISCVLLRHDVQLTAAIADTEEIIALCHGRGIPVLLESSGDYDRDIADIRKTSLDGLHLDLTAGIPAGFDTGVEDYVKTARQNLQREGQILGVDVGASRHNAMLAGQAGADYIGFSGEQLRELAAWWTPLFELPCVGFGVENFVLAQELAKLGCDFVANASPVWQTADDPAGYFEEFQDQLRDVHNI